MKKLFYSFMITGLLAFGLSSCGGEEIAACTAAASNANNDIEAEIACDDCCKDQGYKRGITSTSGSNTTCKCSGEAD